MGKNMFYLLGENESMDENVLLHALSVSKGKLNDSKETESQKGAGHNNSGKNQVNGTSCNGNYLHNSAFRGGYRGSRGNGYTGHYRNLRQHPAENGNAFFLRYVPRKELTEEEKKEKKAWEEKRELRRRKELEEEAKLMTLSQYEKLKQEKKCAEKKNEEEKEKELEKARMMEMQKNFEGMQLVQKKIEDDLNKHVHKSEGTIKRNNSLGKDVKAHKSIITNFHYPRRERDNPAAAIDKEDNSTTKFKGDTFISEKKKYCEPVPEIENEELFPFLGKDGKKA